MKKKQPNKRQTAAQPNHAGSKGLIGFVVGLLLAVIVIGGVLWYINQNPTHFKQPAATPAESESPPEILTPQNNIPLIFTPEIIRGNASASASSDVLGSFIDQQPNETPNTSTDKPTAQTASSPLEKTAKPIVKPAAKNTPETVSPESILNSGSLEKAQKAAAEKAEKETAAKATEKTATETAAKNTEKAAVSRVLLQLGSFKDEKSADSQRAKLAILGVDTHIKSSQVNGSAVYRVETAPMNRRQADTINKQLQQNNIDSLMRTAP
ncbi:SPOR domain-containing protein [Stenoxybacter acetivorans]|uniref:SPOR domain-containing protein n=1 Tax=Stenoxybacter acetivorans TaxID=422441 RepID=UPI000564C4CE|nr:SPOR domain-containing protein [Stenoxybacter acetivorans]